MIKKCIGFLFLILMLLSLTACEEYVSPIMFQLSDSDYPEKYPATVDIDYYIANDTKNLYGKDKYITFKWDNHGKMSYFTAYPVKKTKDGYIIIGSEHDAYAIPNPEKFGYSEIIPLKEKNGTFKMTFEKEYYLKDFIHDSYMSGLDVVCSYNKCLPESEKEK
ncbi:hypothetical protein CVD28_02940 [Bacillus sp. M6-12]|uniref:hypothetical protein n=1 Tax=Bacillus sp. M6-12 TaxID=2054166 RepID=UPI000C785F31|nr:hypothetical protein [Bacillus sp. M6-12]PLS19388.1 hypothetical protein CVD28_02940 [Bacillus sp. M6-12]